MKSSCRALYISALLLLAILSACRSESPPPGEAGPSERAREAEALLAQLEQAPHSTDLQREFLRQFAGIFETEAVSWASLSQASYTVYGKMMSRAVQMARQGCDPCLAAIMRAGLGPLGETAHGSELFSDLLWDLLVEQPQRSFNALATLNASERHAVVEQIYLPPPDEEYDMAKVLALLQTTTIPPPLQAEAVNLLAVIKRAADQQALRNNEEVNSQRDEGR